MSLFAYHLAHESIPVTLADIPLNVFFYEIVPYTILSLFVFGLGLWLAYLIWGRNASRIRLAREQSLRITSKLNHMVEEQNGLIHSLNNRLEVEQKRWNLQLTSKDQKLADLSAQLANFEDGNFEAHLAARDQQIQKLKDELDMRIRSETSLSKELKVKNREIEELHENAVPDDSLKIRVEQLEEILNERDTEIRELNERIESLDDEHDAELAKWANVLKEKETELASKEGVYARLEELEGLLGEKDQEIARLHEEPSEDSEQVEELNRLLSTQDEELKGLEEKIIELEDVLGERESVIVALRNDLSDLEDKAERLLQVEELLHERDEKIQVLEEELSESQNNAKIEELEAHLKKRESDFENLKSQHQESKQDWKNQLHEVKDHLISRESELKSIRAELANAGDLNKRVAELEWILGERDAELHSLREAHEPAAARIGELEHLLRERDGTLEELRKDRDGLHARIEDLEHLVGEKDKQLHERNGIHARVGDLERIVREREGELERLWTENDDLKNQLRNQDTTERASKDGLLDRIQELEWLMGERDSEVERLKFEKGELDHRLRNHETSERAVREDLHKRIEELEWLLKERDSELESYRGDKGGRKDLQHERISDLEWLLSEKEKDIDRLRLLAAENRESARRIERPPSDDLYHRVRELERQLGDQEAEIRHLKTENDDLGSRLTRDSGNSRFEGSRDRYQRSKVRELERQLEENSGLLRGMKAISDSDFRFTLDDGSVVYVKGDEMLHYNGRTYTAADLFKEHGR